MHTDAVMHTVQSDTLVTKGIANVFIKNSKTVHYCYLIGQHILD